MKHGLKLRTSKSPRKGVGDFVESVNETEVLRLLNSRSAWAKESDSVERLEKNLRMWQRHRKNDFSEIVWYQNKIAELLDRRDSDWKDCPNLPAKDWDGNKELVGLRKMLRDLCSMQNEETLICLVYTKELLKMKKDIEQ